MENSYYTLLDQNGRTLVNEIEESIRSEVKVKVDDSRQDKLACVVNKFGATILIPEPGYFLDGSVYHELLHVRRNCVYKIPLIRLCIDYEGPNWGPKDEIKAEDAMTILDNDIEHFIIVPDEINKYPNRENYWKERIETFFDEFEQLSLNTDDRWRHVLKHWAFVHHVFSCNDLVEKANTAVNKLGIKERTSKFLSEIRKALDKKEDLVKAFFKYLEICFDAGCLEYLDCVHKQSHKKLLKKT
jgi:hypothetical protein